MKKKDNVSAPESGINAYDLALNSLNRPPGEVEAPTGDEADSDEAGLSGGLSGTIYAEADIPRADPNPPIFVAMFREYLAARPLFSREKSPRAI